MSEPKKIPTFSWLIRKAERLLRTDPLEYSLMRQDKGTTKMLKGAIVRLELQDNTQRNVFHVYAKPAAHKPRLRDPYFSVDGHYQNGEHYTLYSVGFTTTQYRQRMHKYLPVTMPNGVKCGESTRCVFHNADGTISREGYWHGGKRSRRGSPDCSWLLVRDKDGKFMDSFNGGPGVEIGQNIHFANPTDLIHGFLPGTVQSKLDWYASMVPPDLECYGIWPVMPKVSGGGTPYKVDAPIWDHNKVRTLAAKVHSEAIRISKRFPYLKIALYPAASWKGEDGDYYAEPLRLNRFGGNARRPVVVGRDHNCDPYMWTLPELVLYWTDPVVRYDQKYTVARWIRVVIPPVGCQGLAPQGNSSFSDTYRWGKSQGERNYQRQILSGTHALEAAHHGLICRTVGSQEYMNLVAQQRYRSGNVDRGVHAMDAKTHDWNDQSVVVVYDNSEEQPYAHHIDPTAAKPEGLFAKIEERELIDSLPLC